MTTAPLEAGQLTAQIDENLLPANPEDWLFVLTGEDAHGIAGLTESLSSLGFAVACAVTIDETAKAWRANRTIVVAAVSRLNQNPDHIAGLLTVSTTDSLTASSLLVAINDTGDFNAQIKARQTGAQLLLNLPLTTEHLITELAGLAWMPRASCRVMLIDDNPDTLDFHAQILLRQTFEHFIVSHDIAATSKLLLDGILLLSDSPYGFLGEVLQNPDGTSCLKTHAASDISWCKTSETHPNEAAGLRNLDNLIGAVLRTGETVIVNDPFHDPSPQGYPPINAFLGIPIRHKGLLIGLLGLANRPGNYDAAIADFLQAATTGYAAILEAARLRLLQQQIIDELHRARDNPDIVPDATSVAIGNGRHDRKRRILVAEDNPANQAVLRMQLEALGYEADIASVKESQAILDTDYLARIVGTTDTRQTCEIVDLFTTTARGDLPLCQRHLEQCDGRKLALIMHKLKSSARMVGALRFAGLAETLEDTAKAGRLEAAAALIAELEYALNDVEVAVSRFSIPSANADPAKPSAQPAAITATVTSNQILEGIRRDEFTVYFQPKVDANTLRVVGVEALARWQHDGRLISPDRFIETAEQCGLIAALSEVLVIKAMIGGVRLSDAGFPLAVAVNLSMNWLNNDINLPEFIISGIQATGFKAENLILEITETGVMTDRATSMDVTTRLRIKGFKLSIDDFGTGCSSMDQLQRFPFSGLKLDRSFVHEAAEKPAKRAILSSSIEMAKKLNLFTVAEGVETQADLDLVRGLGCDQVQGWYIAKAMPIEELIVWLRHRFATQGTLV